MKQCILLEDHLNNVSKRCFQCLVKHLMTIEAFAEEAISLVDEDKRLVEYINLHALAGIAREWIRNILKSREKFQGPDEHRVHLDKLYRNMAIEVRRLRKMLWDKGFGKYSEILD